MRDELAVRRAKVAADEVLALAIELGGTISGEHGIGSKRKKYLSLVMQPEAIELMKHIKAAFDPNNILNPGKIFPDSP